MLYVSAFTRKDSCAMKSTNLDNSAIFYNYQLLDVLTLTKLITLLHEKPHAVPEKTEFG